MFENNASGDTGGGRRSGGGRADGAPVSPEGSEAGDDASFAPVHGISLDRYAEVSASLDRLDPSGSARDEWLTAHGVPTGAWDEIHAEWRRRMAGNAQIRNRFAVLFSQF